MDRSWKIYVADLCSEAWGLSSRRIQRVIEGIEVLIVTDQLSDFSLAGLLSSVGMSPSRASAAAPSIRAAIGGGSRHVTESPVPSWPALGSKAPHPGS